MIEKEFVTAGRAVFTVEPSATFQEQFPVVKPHYTYKVKFVKGKEKKDKPGEFWSDAYMVFLLTGPDNTADYTYLGMLDDKTGYVRLTAKSKWNDDTWPVKIIRRVLARLWAGECHEIAANGWKVHHEGRCGRCGRALTVPESVENGIGPECIKKVFGAAA